MIGLLPDFVDNDKPAIYFHGRCFTYGNVKQEIHNHQARLTNLFPNFKGKKIALLLENGPQLLTLFLAVSAFGGVAVPFDPKWSKNQSTDVWQDCNADYLLYHASLKEQVEIEGNEKAMEFESFLKLEHVRVNQAPLDKEDLFYIGYTSGTIGTPKGYMRNHRSWYDCFQYSKELFTLSEKDHILVPGPLVHSHFLYAAVQALHLGATIYLCSRFDASYVWGIIHTAPITVLYQVPTMFEAMYKKRQAEHNAGNLRIIISSGDKWSFQSKEKAALLFPTTELYEFYGASELSFVSLLSPGAHHRKSQTVGRPFAGVDVKVKHDDGTEAARNEVGKLYVRSPWVFAGYVNRPSESAEVFDGEWATVGDLAFIDDEGYIHLVGRERNKIISGGLNVYPEQVEVVIKRMQAIDEVVVIGLDDAYWGEKVVACYTAKFPQNVESMKAHCREHLATYQCPKEFIEVEQFPYTSSGKIARGELKNRLSARQQGGIA
ncbi:AMP-binding protein [Bacillus tianshenii]|nr:AMP-binding protein [Bacillus tianshenii]